MAASSSLSSSEKSAEKTLEISALPPSSSSSFFDSWPERIFYPTLIGGFVGGAVGLVSKHRKIHGVANISATYATNLAILTGCYCGAREFVRVSRKSEHGDLVNSAVGGLCSGALLGRLQEWLRDDSFETLPGTPTWTQGQTGAIRYSIMFAVIGTTVDYATPKLCPLLKTYRDSLLNGELKLPEWSPIQILDEEALAAKRVREEQLRAHTAIIIRDNEA